MQSLLGTNFRKQFGGFSASTKIGKPHDLSLWDVSGDEKENVRQYILLVLEIVRNVPREEGRLNEVSCKVTGFDGGRTISSDP